ncbi:MULTISPECIES: IS3 family transposase [Lachnospiraceae]|nr:MULTISPECIES: IS3 family transposase [Lachnospiraceae]RGD08484.1 IS3 family transposase [Lachnospiraceae bacterium AM25-11LB]ASM69431.1 hypothetical protein CGC63_07715 [Blautia hansenii DSM 20583]MDB8682803.1 IS3 family transposase [Mediterraneibacter gnavus]MDB8695364.1 IS3 family transposase [Mediterraneibacter gnavus]MDB8701436.1 IS3 family transposase [Mediterraneibacter gnavus]
MTKKYSEEFKKQMVQEYLKGTSYPKLSKEYQVAKSTLVGWVKKYSEECQSTKPQTSPSFSENAKEIHELHKRIQELEKENLFKKSGGILCKGNRLEAYRFIDEHKDFFGLRWLLKHFHIYPNAYYNYRKNRKKSFLQHRQQVFEQIKTIYYNNNRILGHRPMRIFLKRQEISLSKTTVHKYMNQILGLHARIMRKKPAYVHGTKNKIFPNLLKQDFHCTEPNRIWCTDFTYIRMRNGKMRYNCSILDLYDRSIVATLNSDYINTELAKATLEKALMEEKPEKGLILHSDQGCQFTSWGFINYCESRGICQSMSKAGCPYDNAPMERFYNTLKNELIYPNHFYDAASLDEALNRYVYVWYNHVRPHSYNDWKTPFEARYAG